MRRDVDELLRRQDEWQRAQARRPWSEKVRVAEALRDSLERWRQEPPPKHVGDVDASNRDGA